MKLYLMEYFLLGLLLLVFSIYYLLSERWILFMILEVLGILIGLLFIVMAFIANRGEK